MRILRIGTLILALGSLAGTALAQKAATRVGVLAGANFATVKGDSVTGVSTLTGFMGGLTGEFALSRNLALEPEILYTMKGMKDTESGATMKLKLNYIEVPILLKVVFPPSKESQWAVRPHLYLGPAIGFKVSCKVVGEEGNVSLDVDCKEFSDLGEFKSTDFSAMVGGGLDFGNLTLGLRYDYGFTNIATNAAGPDVDGKNRVFSVYLGYAFKLKK